MKCVKKIGMFLLAFVLGFHPVLSAVYADTEQKGFELVKTQEIAELGGIAYYYRHSKTGAEVVYLDNGAERLEFSIGFKTPPGDSKGANHVLEHGLLCGSQKYPTKNVMHYMGQGSASLITMGVTVDDCTYYPIKTSNMTEYYNVMDVYLNGIFHPLLLKDENIFRQQGIRLEYTDGKVRYNGVVYNELRMKKLDTAQNSLTFLGDKLYEALYGATTPAFHSGGGIEELKTLTYEDVLRVYNTYYIPSNSMTFLAGKQDINKTLNVLDRFFAEFEKQEISIFFQDTKRLPTEPVSEYNVTNDTATVDIGFMSCGVPVYGEQKELYTRDIIFNIIRKPMDQLHHKTYVLGGNSGGISTMALLVSEVPVGQKDEVISSYNAIIKQLESEGFDHGELETEIESYFADRKNPYTNSTDLKIFNGILYHHDPFINAALTATQTGLMDDKDYFNTVLQKYFTENPYSKVVVSGNSAAPVPEDTVDVSGEELERIKQETAEFQKWAEEPDDPSVIERLPLLSLDEVKDAPELAVPTYEQAEGISFYHTKKNAENSASLFFPLAVENENLNHVQLMYAFLTDQARKAGLSNVYFSLLPMEHSQDSKKINPQLLMGISGENIPAELERVVEFLQDETVWSGENLEEYMKTAPARILENSYEDPYFLSYELMRSAHAAGSGFCFSTTGSIQQGSPMYYHFLKKAGAGSGNVLIEKIKELLHAIILENKPTAEYLGRDGYEAFKNAVTAQFKNNMPKENGIPALLAGCDSAATITTQKDANHFMITGCYDGKDYSGKLPVLGKVLSSKYLEPTLRGKYGAYGAGISFNSNHMVSSVTGIGEIDLTVEVWRGMGDYLRSLNITQNELDAMIVSAVKKFDQYDYTSSEFGAQAALLGQSASDLERLRKEMLSTTVEDLRSCADFVDSLVAQNRVFAVLGQEAAERAAFPFTYYADADTLEITPRWKKDISGGYINGKTDKQFAPDDKITRGETAALITRVTADSRGPEFGNRFQDVSSGDWYYEPIVSAAEKNMMSGYDGGVFLPEKNITRAELAAVLSKFIFQGKTELAAGYSDLSQGDWYYDAMAKLVNAGAIQGYEDGTIRPDAYVTRAELVVMVNRLMGVSDQNTGNNPFEDVSAGHWAYQDILAAVG